MRKVSQLDEVVIELPIIVRRDTIIYNTDKFITGEERKLKDILKKLPGIEVDENGIVTSNGKIITHLLVENKKFFNGDSKLAVDNIPANAVDRVVVIDDYNEVAFLKGLTSTQNMAMNIKLKKNKKNFVFGDLEAGKGTNRYYKAHSNLFYYNPKFNFNFIGNLNNTGEKVLSSSDYLNFKGGPSSALNPRDYYLDKSSFSKFIEPLNVISSENKMAALNITSTISDKFNLSSYMIFSHSNFMNREERINEYLVPDSNYIEDVSDNENGRNISGIAKVNLKYVPSIVEQWDLKMLFKKSNSLNGTSTFSTINETTKSIINSTDEDNEYINGNLEWHKRINKKHVFSFNSFFIHYKNNPNDTWDISEPILQDLLPLSDNENIKLRLLRNENRNSLNTIFKHYWVISKKSQFHTTVGNVFKTNKFSTNDYEELENGAKNDFSSAGFNNDLSYKFNDFYFGVNYKLRTGKFEFRPSIFAHYYSWNINQENKIKKNKLVLLPHFSTTLKFGRTDKLSLSYGLQSSFSGASKFANRFYLQSYNLAYRGNENLENEVYHYSNLVYYLSNLYRGLFLISEFRYTNKVKGVKDIIQTDASDNYLSPIMLNNPSESLAGTFILNKTRKNIKFSVRANLITSKFQELINSDISKSKSTNGSYKVSIQSMHEKFPVIKIGFKQSIGSYILNDKTTKFSSDEPFINFDYDFLKSFVFSFDYTHYRYKNKSLNASTTYNLTNTMITYGKENSAWNFKISAENLFDVRFKNSNNFNSYIISDTKAYILPRVIMFSIIYKI